MSACGSDASTAAAFAFGPPWASATARARAPSMSSSVRPSTSGDSARSRTRAGAIVPAAQREPEFDAIARVGEVASRELLDLADAVAQRVAVAVQPLGRALPLPVALDERLQRAHQLVAVVAVGGLDRAEDGVAEEPERIVVLEGEQQLEGAELAIRRQAPRPRRAGIRRLARVPVAVRGPGRA